MAEHGLCHLCHGASGLACAQQPHGSVSGDGMALEISTGCGASIDGEDTGLEDRSSIATQAMGHGAPTRDWIAHPQRAS